MIIPLLMAAVVTQTAQTPTPPLPMQARIEFQDVVYGIQNALVSGNTVEAERLGKLLPKAKVTLGWDESSIPENMRSQIDQARDLMLQAWKHINGVDITTAASGDINIRFSKDLPKDSAGMPVEAVLKFGDSPRLDVTISVIRGNPAQSIVPNDAYMEIGHAIGAYFGIADDVLAGSCMFRDDRPGLQVFGPSRPDYFIASDNLKLSAALQVQIANKEKPASIDMPLLGLQAPKTELGPVPQGTKVPLEFKVKNNGKGTLTFHLVPDCGCFSFPPPGQAGPGQEVTVRTVMDTSYYIGNVEKALVLYSNDPKDPVHTIPVTFKSMPLARLYRPDGDTVGLPAANDTIDILMTVPDGSKMMPQQYEWNGFPAKATMDKWSGVAADQELNEGVKPRHGYVFHIKLDKNQLPGRETGTLQVVTNDESVPQLSYTIYAQKGIIATPPEQFVSDIQGVSRVSYEIIGPGKPFKILGVDVGSKALKASVYKKSDTDYQVDVILDPARASKGDFTSYVKIRTDDPNQPVVHASIRGTIL